MLGIPHKMAESSTDKIQKEQDRSSGEYKFLRAENQKVIKTEWSQKWLLSEYVRFTDGLIGYMDGTISKDNAYPPDSVIYLDKSARPIQWLVNKLWPLLARKPGANFEDGEIPPKPREYFVNIDKVDWLKKMGVPEKYIEDAPNELIDINKIGRAELARLRALFCHLPSDETEEEILASIWNRPTIFEGQHVLIVDEVKSSGKTLEMALMLLRAAIPEATFNGGYWATPPQEILNSGVVDKETRKLQFQMKWAAIWYDEKSASGRGVGDKNRRWVESAQNIGYNPLIKRKIGQDFLSTPSHDPDTLEKISDPKADMLRHDFGLLATDLSQGKILYRPSWNRSIDDRIERIKVMNKMDLKTWKEKVRDLEPRSRS